MHFTFVYLDDGYGSPRGLGREVAPISVTAPPNPVELSAFPQKMFDIT
jgi:hypothetical protein